MYLSSQQRSKIGVGVAETEVLEARGFPCSLDGQLPAGDSNEVEGEN